MAQEMRIINIAKLDVHTVRKYPHHTEEILRLCYEFQGKVEALSTNIGVSIEFYGDDIEDLS